MSYEGSVTDAVQFLLQYNFSALRPSGYSEADYDDDNF